MNPATTFPFRFALLGWLLGMMPVIATQAEIPTRPDTLWSENWEGDWTANWFVDAGTWEVGEPKSGPNAAYTGEGVAATVLAGNYSDDAPDSRLVRYRSFVVPDSLESPQLRFWHWFSFSSGDYGRVEISTDGGGTWEALSPNYFSHSTDRWTRPLLDLSAYAGKEVQLAFLFHSQRTGTFSDSRVGPGWYIDDLMVVTGSPLSFVNPEGWESGIRDWVVDFGTWEVGTPTSGPGSAHTGQQVAATILGGDYNDDVADSQLISPYVVVPDSLKNPRLRFWHWFSFGPGDYGEVKVRARGGAWITIGGPFSSNSSGVWSFFVSNPLSHYAGKEVQFAFFFHAQRTGTFNDFRVGPGWYIDDLTVEGLVTTATEPKDKPTSFALHGAYPNPSALATAIRFDLREAAAVTLRVFDVLGREVHRADAGLLAAGTRHGVRVSAETLPSGTYFYRLEARMAERTEARSGTFTRIE